MTAGLSAITVRGLELEPIGGAVPRLENASRAWSERRGVLVRLDSGDASGLGEASPLPGYSPDTLEEAVAELRALELPAELTPGEVRLRSPSARFAIDTALLDAAGRRAGLPSAQLLSPEAADRTLELAALISSSPARTEGDAGVTNVVKVKIGRNLPDELECIAELRSRGLAVRADANRCLDPSAAASILAELARLGVASIEEPVDPEVLFDLSLPLPVALDETLAEPGWQERAARLARRGVLAALVVKPARVGGLAAVVAAAAVARELGSDLIVSHLFDGPVALASCWQLALALATDCPQGLAPHPALVALAPAGLIVPRLANGAITGDGGSGLGLRIGGDREAACP